jgi:hypothetical protein
VRGPLVPSSLENTADVFMKRPKIRPLAGLFTLLALAGCSAAAGDLDAADLNAADLPVGKIAPKTERVIAFKDGYALVIKRAAAVTDENGQLYLDDVPDAAVLGSFWAAPDEGRLTSMVAGWEEVEEQAEQELPCIHTIELLVANKGKNAKIELHDKTVYSGVIHEVLVERGTAAAPPHLLEALSANGRITLPLLPDGTQARVQPADSATIGTIGGTNFVLRTEEGDVMLPAGQVRSVLVKEMKTTLARTLTSQRRTKRLTFSFDQPKQKQGLNLMYFRPGVRWIPTYRIELDPENEKKQAKVELQAELLNEAEDFKDVPIDIVVGVPNFRFRQTPSPLTLESVLRNALLESDPQLMGQMSNSLSNAMYTQRSGEFRRNAAAANAVAEGGQIDLPGELTATGAQDLFVYSLPKLSMEKGERAAVPIFTAKTPYRDVYTWEVHVSRSDIEAAPSGAGVNSPLTLSNNEVWHQIELTNTTKLPWTTGAALLMQNQQPLSQELLTYTPAKNDVRVPVTVSVETRGSFTEKEIGRDLKALNWDGYNYARIQKEAALHLCNNKPVAIDAEITLRLGGKVDAASDKGDVTLAAFNQADWVQYNGSPAVNNSSVVTWKIKLQPGETFEPTVTYHFYARH